MELWARSAGALAAAIRAGEVSSRAVIDAHLGRIEAINPAANALTLVMAEAARADARAPRGPLAGVPFTIKGNLDCLGTPTTHGVRALAAAMPYLDAPAVARLKAAGAIPIGRGNLSELGLRLDTDNPLYGRTRNPWDPRLTAGGSSGGDAVAVATGMTPLALGTDIGGSLRVPAACCGVATLKPTTGRIAHASSLPPEDFGAAGQLMLAPGPIARNVADLRLALELLAGRDRRDPRSVDVPLVGAPVPRRAALVTGDAAVVRAGGLLAAAGWEVEEAEPPEIDRVGELWHKLIAVDLAAVMPFNQPLVSPALYAHVQRLCQAARAEEVPYSRLHEERARLQRAWSGFFAEYAVAIMPSLAAPWPIDADLDPRDGIPLLARATRFILPGNALALPVLALPVGAGAPPPGIQIYADLWREDLCLAAGAIVEDGAGRLPIDPKFSAGTPSPPRST